MGSRLRLSWPDLRVQAAVYAAGWTPAFGRFRVGEHLSERIPPGATAIWQRHAELAFTTWAAIPFTVQIQADGCHHVRICWIIPRGPDSFDSIVYLVGSWSIEP